MMHCWSTSKQQRPLNLLPARHLDILRATALARLPRRYRHIGDFTRWKEHDAYQKALDRLLRDLRVEKG
jgi:hypothetical protein